MLNNIRSEGMAISKKKTTATKSVKARTIQMIDPQSGGILKMYNIMKLKM